MQKVLKIKAQSFFKKIQLTPLLREDAYSFHLFAEFPPLKKEAVKEKVFIPKHYPEQEQQHEVIRHANFETEIDLHIEKLIPSHKGMSNTEIIKIQLSRCRRCLDGAIANNIPRVYVIHGLGKGKLREEIHLLLAEYPEVHSFNNNYHPKYAYGATEIVFEKI